MTTWKKMLHRCARPLCAIFIVLAFASGAAPQPAQAAPLIGVQNSWRYNDGGKDLGTAWRSLAYDDSAWKSGPGPLGYGYSDLKTQISFGASTKAKHPTYYFRSAFVVTDTQNIESLRLSLRYDDGFVAYVNGTEVARSNLSSARPLKYDTLADQPHRGYSAENFDLAAALPLLVQGKNILAVEVHQSELNSGKLLLDAALESSLVTDPPAFTSNPALSELVDTSVRVQFQSNVRTQARIEYGIAPALDQSSDIAMLANAHDIALKDLRPESTYRYRVGIRTREDQPYVWTEPLEFSTPNTQSVQVAGHALIPARSDWKYDDSGQEPGAGWNTSRYDDSAWKSGNAPFGYGYPEVATTTSYGSDSKNRYPTTYFRKTFTVTDTRSIESINLSVRYDDGFVAYLNGQELVRASMPVTGTLSSTTFAATSHRSSGFEAFDLLQALAFLKQGQNVLAFEVHQASKASNDLLFDAALSLALVSDPPALLGSPLLGQVTTSSIHVQFESNVPTLARVEYGVAPALDRHVESPDRSSTHDVVLSGLAPGSTYRYRVGVRTTADQPLVWSAPFDFTTDGGPGTSFRFGVWADSRPNNGFAQPQIFVRNIRNLVDRKPLALAIAIGDNVQLRNSSDAESTITSTVRSAYIGYYKAVGDLASTVPLYTAIGNHDNPLCAACLAGFRRYFPNPPANGELFYSFDYGDAHFTVLDSRQNTTGGNAGLSLVQRRWLRDDLTTSTKRYKFVFIHDAMYHNQDSEVYDQDEKAELHQIFLTTGVTAVFQGDAHYYDYTVVDGLPYVVTGGAGSPLYTQPYNASWSVNETVIVSVSPNEVGFQAIKADGSILDRRVLPARSANLPAVPAASTAPSTAQNSGGQAVQTSRSADSNWFMLGLVAALGLALGIGGVLLLLWMRQRARVAAGVKMQANAGAASKGDIV